MEKVKIINIRHADGKYAASFIEKEISNFLENTEKLRREPYTLAILQESKNSTDKSHAENESHYDESRQDFSELV